MIIDQACFDVKTSAATSLSYIEIEQDFNSL